MPMLMPFVVKAELTSKTESRNDKPIVEKAKLRIIKIAMKLIMLTRTALSSSREG